MNAPVPDGEKSTLREVRERLYANKPLARQTVAGTKLQGASAEGWAPEPEARRGLSATAWFFLISLGFFVIAGIAAALILFFGGRTVGTERMDVRFEGPVSTAGGEEVPFDIQIENGNPVEATDIVVKVRFPKEAVDPMTRVALGNYESSVGTLLPGEAARRSIRVTYFGSENQRIDIPVTVEYRTPNSSAIFKKEETRTITLTTAPLSIRVDAASNTASGQEVQVVARVRSNAPDPVDAIALKVSYPFGFSFTEATPSMDAPGIFVLGTLMPGEEKEVVLRGVLVGEDGDERVFRFEAGLLEGGETIALRSPAFTVAALPISVTRSFIGTTLSLNQEDADITLQAGEVLNGLVSWTNALTTSIQDARISIHISGNALDTSSVEVGNGFYRSSDQVMVFDQATEQDLAVLRPGETGAGAFTVDVKSAEELALLRGPSASFTISVSGTREGEGRVEEVRSALTRTVRIATDLTLASSLTHEGGPLPPQADTGTTYLVEWEVENTINTVANAAVSAKLPAYVQFSGSSSGITYNEATRTVSWALGEVVAGVARRGTFEIVLTPSVTQQGASPILLEDQRLSGFDRFIQEEVGETESPLTTASGFSSEEGRVE